MRPTRLTLVCLLLAAVGCGGDDGDTGAGTGETGADSSSSTMGFPSTSDDSTDDTLTTVSATDESTSDADSTTATTGDPDTSSGATETGNENLCMPDGDDDECYVCGKENCCEEYMACVAEDPNCGCVLDCLAALDDPGPTEAMTCSEQCDADFISLTPFFMMNTMCQLENCGMECGG